MNRLFSLGYDPGRRGYFWMNYMIVDGKSTRFRDLQLLVVCGILETLFTLRHELSDLIEPLAEFPFMLNFLQVAPNLPIGAGVSPMRAPFKRYYNTVFGYRFSVKKTRIISKFKLKLVALETELINTLRRATARHFIQLLIRRLSRHGLSLDKCRVIMQEPL